MTYEPPKYPGIRTDRPTHIIRDWGADHEDPIALCGAQNGHDNYLTHREMYGITLIDDKEIYISKDELQMHRDQLCEKCKNHPDLAILLLADI